MSTAEKLIRVKADTFRARLRLGLGFGGAVHVPETLKLRDTAVTQLCDTLCVDGDLDLADCSSLERLPDRLIVRGKLILDGCVKLEALPPTIRELLGLSAKDCTRLKSIVPLVECRGSLDLVGCDAMEPLPSSLCAYGKVTLKGCVLRPDRIVLDEPVPETLAIALSGRRLGDVVNHRLLVRHGVSDAIITKAGHDRYFDKFVIYADCSGLVRERVAA